MKTHSIEEIQELKEWFDNHELPGSLQLDKATYIEDVKETISSLIEQSLYCYDNPKMQGGIVLLEKIKIKVEESFS